MKDSGSDLSDGHEDKRSHPNDKSTPAKKGGRKSLGVDEGKLSAKEKAARRKEQNRAAQKAFRERRENKVKDVGDITDHLLTLAGRKACRPRGKIVWHLGGK